ncbi:30S ribosomal protein S1 [Peptococcaceae bacterium CEB3]|nr:30S ribosomal protein S1 [Peptococcaceae bacterium CEB3]
MGLLKKMIEGYDEQKAIEILSDKDYWQDVIRAEQNKLIMQEPLFGIETHDDIPCAVCYIGNIKGLIPIIEFGPIQHGRVNTLEDLKDPKKVEKTYQLMHSMTGQQIAFLVKGHDKKENIFTASRREALEWMKKRTEETLAVGSKTLAVIRNVTPVRAIADIGGITATLSAAEYQHGWIEDLTDHIMVGDHISAQIIEYDKDKNRAVISRKVLLPDPWEDLGLVEQSVYICEIAGVRQGGCYFRLKTQRGYVDGFLRHPRHEKLARGDKALVKIINIDNSKRRIFAIYVRPLKIS